MTPLWVDWGMWEVVGLGWVGIEARKSFQADLIHALVQVFSLNSLSQVVALLIIKRKEAQANPKMRLSLNSLSQLRLPVGGRLGSNLISSSSHHVIMSKLDSPFTPRSWVSCRSLKVRRYTIYDSFLSPLDHQTLYIIGFSFISSLFLPRIHTYLEHLTSLMYVQSLQHQATAGIFGLV